MLDAANGLVSLARGNFTDALFSGISMLPVVGSFIGKGGKVARSATKHADEAADLLKGGSDVADAAKKSRKLDDVAGAGAKKIDDAKGIRLEPYGGSGGGHHIPAKKGFEGAPGYNPNVALAIPNSVLKSLNINHNVVTGAQSSLYTAFAKTGKQLTWKIIEEIETTALVKGGATRDQRLRR